MLSLVRQGNDAAGAATAVSGLWQELWQARYSCEQMAARGVRVAKDLAAEVAEAWASGAEREEALVAEVEELRHCVSGGAGGRPGRGRGAAGGVGHENCGEASGAAG